MSDIKLRIDTRYYRWYIHRQALKAIGDPEFINFAYNPESMRLMIIGSGVDDRKSVRVRYSKTGTVCVYSQPLLEGIRRVSGILVGDASYLVEGILLESEKIIIYPLMEAQITFGEDFTEENPITKTSQ